MMDHKKNELVEKIEPLPRLATLLTQLEEEMRRYYPTLETVQIVGKFANGGNWIMPAPSKN